MKVAWIVGISLGIVLLASAIAMWREPRDHTGGNQSRPQGAPGAPSLLLVTIDTWRWDYIGVSGAGKVRTPNLDRLAKEGVYEGEAVTPCPLTTPAHASLLTGLDVLHHKVWDCTAYKLDPSTRTLTQALRETGYKTAAFVAGETLKRRYGLDRGFDVYDDSGMDKRSRGDWMSSSRDGSTITDAALAYLGSTPGTSRLFLWAHYYDLHLPHRARPGLDSRYPGDPYAAQVAYVDGQVARLVAALEADRGRSWRVVIVGDHGEGLGEKGEDTHGIGLYRATLHVPLILWPKPEKPLAHPKPWGLVDLFPTLQAWFGLRAGPGGDGEDLFERGTGDRPLAAVSVEPTLMFGVAPFTGIRKGRYLYLRDGSEELYDQVNDPGQRSNLAKEGATHPELESFRRIFPLNWPPGWVKSTLSPTLSASAQDLMDLQSLGYISGPVSTGGALQPASMGKVLLDRSAWDRAREEAYRTNKGDALLALYPRLVADYPVSAALRKAYGTLLAQAGKTPEAIRQLEQAVRLNPRDSASLTNLGGLYIQAGRMGPAQLCLERALALDASNAMAHKNLGVLYADHLNLPKEAIPHYQKYLSLGGDSDTEAIRVYIRNHGIPPPQGPPK